MSILFKVSKVANKTKVKTKIAITNTFTVTILAKLTKQIKMFKVTDIEPHKQRVNFK